jgi:hypothetical protein
MRLESTVGGPATQDDPKAAWLQPDGEKEGAGFGNGRMVGGGCGDHP